MYSVAWTSVIDLSSPANIIGSRFVTIAPSAIYLPSAFINTEDALINYWSEGLFFFAPQHFCCLGALSPQKITPARESQGDKTMLPPSSWSSSRQLRLQPLIPVTVYLRRLGRNPFLWRGCDRRMCCRTNCERSHHNKQKWKHLKSCFWFIDKGTWSWTWTFTVIY